jgi:hypothetical protein
MSARLGDMLGCGWRSGHRVDGGLSTRAEAITSDCDIREGTEVAELTNLDPSRWAGRIRANVRRVKPHQGAQLPQDTTRSSPK